MKKLLIGAGALALAAPATAQVATPAPAPQAQRAVATKAHTRADVQAHVAQMFAKLDADRDGFVTKAEVDAGRAAIGAQVRERIRQRAGAKGGMFAQLDTNKDGAISQSEFEAGRAQRKEHAQGEHREGARREGGMHRMAMMMGGRMFEAADADRDGRVSLQEAQAGALRHFDTLDANRDGQITREERMQKRKRVRNAPSAG